MGCSQTDTDESGTVFQKRAQEKAFCYPLSVSPAATVLKGEFCAHQNHPISTFHPHIFLPLLILQNLRWVGTGGSHCLRANRNRSNQQQKQDGREEEFRFHFNAIANLL